jgi:glycosyltransferase involved in cell wall biosynthesis
MDEITIVIALYNGVEFIEEAITSIRVQIYSRWKCIIGVNGHGPTGGEVFSKVQEILNKIGDNRFRVVNLPNVNGVVEADNALLDLADTEWVAHLDADDIWDGRKLQFQVNTYNELIKNNIEVDCIATKCKYFGVMDGIPDIPSGLLTEEDFKTRNPIIHSSVLLRKKYVRYNKEEGGFVTQDYMAFLDMIGKGLLIYTIELPLTFHRVYPQSNFNQSGKQNPALVAKKFWSPDTHEHATVVSSFYEMPSKFSQDVYIHWIRQFMNNPFYLVLFIEQQHLDLFTEMRKGFADRTKIVVLPREEWVANTKWGQNIWTKQCELDKESKHSPDLYKVWYEKKEFVKRAIQLNPFGHTKYVWCDAGIVRYPEVGGWLKGFARADRIPDNRLLLLQVDNFTQDDCMIQSDGLYGDFKEKNRIGGGVQAGSISTWLKWSDKYDVMMQRYINVNRFIGKDQSIMASVILENPTDVLLINPPKGLYRHPLKIWFFLVLWLSCNKKRFDLLMERF